MTKYRKDTGRPVVPGLVESRSGLGTRMGRRADCYSFSQQKDRAIAILRQGMEVRQLRERELLTERLDDLEADYDPAVDPDPDWSVVHDAELNDAGDVFRAKTTVTFGGDGLPLDQMGQLKAALGAKPRSHQAGSRRGKVGRNEPCPCGSGRKFKKCCGK